MGTNECPLCVVSEWTNGDKSESGPASKSNAAIIGESDAPVWALKTLSGESIDSDSSKGKVSVLVYWASWCAPCREEVPSLIALREEFPASDLEIIGVSLDDAPRSIETFVKTYKINYTIARNNDSLDEAFGPVRYIPTMVILDKNGQVQQRYTGLVGHEVIRGQIETLLNESA